MLLVAVDHEASKDTGVPITFEPAVFAVSLLAASGSCLIMSFKLWPAGEAASRDTGKDTAEPPMLTMTELPA
ncbi:hypothetical protein D3C73_685070 [compost metagenome]